MDDKYNDDYPLGSAANRPPLLLGTHNYNWWKNRMKMHLSNEPKEWRVVFKGPYTFTTDDGKPMDIDDLNDAEVLKLSYNNRAMNTIMTGLSTSESDKVSSCTSAKEMWDILERYHEGTKPLRKVKLGQLLDDYGTFKLKENETIHEAQA